MVVSLGFWFLLAASPPVTLPPPIPLPASISPTRTAPATAGPHILYLNFNGASLTGSASCSDATINCSFIVKGTVNMPAFSGSATDRANIIAKVVEYYSPFNVEVTVARPPSGPYSMVMVGGHAADVGIVGMNAAGVAPLDCQDRLSQSDIAFACSEEVANAVLAVAVTIAEESAHGYGLGHTNEMADIMYPVLSGMETGFLDKNMSIIDASSCGSPMQNSKAQLLQTVGPAETGPD